MAIIVLCFGAVGGRVLLLEVESRARASDGVVAARLAALTLAAATRLSFERGPTNGALGTEAPLPAERSEPLKAFRAATDAAFDALSRELRAANEPWAKDVPGELEIARRHLGDLRRQIDAIVSQPLAGRSQAAMNLVVAGLIAVIPELSPGLNVMEARLARADPRLISLITAARVATEMRDYAGQIGSVLTSAVAGRRPMTLDETTRLARTNGHLDALNDQFRLAYEKLGRNPEMDQALADIETHFFGVGLDLARRLAESGRTTGAFNMSTAEFAARFVPELQSVVALRDTTVKQFSERINKVLEDSTTSLAVNGLAVALVMVVVGVIYWLMRMRVSLPLRAVSDGLQRMASGDLNATIATRIRPDEIGAVIGALHAFRAADANRRELEDRTNRLLSERACELERLTVELRAAKDGAEAASLAKGHFLATMSHEIRSPMSGLLGVIELLRDTKLDTDQAQMVELVQGSAASLLRVLNDVLDFSKIDAGKVELVPEPTDMRLLITGLIGSMTPNATAKGLSLVADVADELPTWISTDPSRLRQILINLLANAIKFTGTGSVHLSVTGATMPDGACVVFAVRDSGIGIAPDVIPRLFEPFTQADASTTRTFGGTGLGLTISRRLARLLGGEIEVTSALGQGSVFSLRIPLVQTQPAVAASIQEAPGQDAALNGLRILVAEDQITNRWLIERQLKRFGCAVTAVEEGRAAVAALDTDAYDLLITDCHMPVIDGLALTRLIRGAEVAHGTRRLPILGLTADVTAGMRQRCLAAGMNDVVAKPVNLRHLHAAISGLLQIAGADAVVTGGGADALVFDPATYHELFADDECEGRQWLGAYLVSAAEVMACVEQGAASGDRDVLASNAHKLASASLAVGAMCLGWLGRRLESAALEAPADELREVADQVVAAWRDAQQAISRFIVEPETVA